MKGARKNVAYPQGMVKRLRALLLAGSEMPGAFVPGGLEHSV